MSGNSFKDRLAATMDAAGIRQSDLVRMAAEKGAKLGKSQVSQYVSGKVTPRRDVMALLADLLRVDAAWLAGVPTNDSTPSVGRVPAASPVPPARASGPGVAPATPSPTTASPASASAPVTTVSNDIQGETPMRQFKKSDKLDNVLYDVRGPVVDEAARMEEDPGRGRF